MKKKFLGVLLTVAMAAAMVAGCGAGKDGADQPAAGGNSDTSQEGEADHTTKVEGADDVQDAVDQAPEGDGKKVTALFISLEGEYFTFMEGLLKEGLTAKGYEYESQSCNMDPVTMIEQVENAVAGGTDLIWMWAPSGETLHDACKAAKDQGVLVYAFIMDVGEDARDVFRGTDETVCGEAIAEMASEWADKNWTEDRKIRTILFGNTDSSQQKERLEAMAAKIKQDDRFEILEEAAFAMSITEAQSYAENMFNKHGDIDCFITTGGEYGIGVCAYTHSESSPVASDPSKVAVFATEITAETASYIKDGSLKGVAVNGGVITENIATQVEQMDTLLQGGTVEPFSKVDIGRCTLDNIADYGF